MVKMKREAEARLVCSECDGEVWACRACGRSFNLFFARDHKVTMAVDIICDDLGRAHYCRACDPRKQVDKR